jgi:general secretion pathway protein H
MISPPDRDCRYGPLGFTLIELLVVLAILALAIGLIAGFKPPWSRALGIDAAAADLAAGLRLARAEAIGGNRPVAFDLDLVRRQYRVGKQSPRPLPSGLAVELLTVEGERRGTTSGDIRFNPDGSSTGGRITLAAADRRVAIGVEWLTGRVSIADVR